ncbi:uncharacterized protein LOC143173788 [Aptenodytes patagonicus]|uniref:uncharacterized protein LOC143173587 n=1 Tax=Aptenodytes patagonicus TaxID=9234 RepID=UPI003FA119E2
MLLSGGAVSAPAVARLRDTWTTTGFAEELPRLKLKKPEKDDGIGSAYRASQLDPGYEPWGRPRDVARGRAFSWLNPVLDPSWHPKETDRETLQKQAFQKGSSHTVPVSDEEREAMQEAGTPGADAGKKAEAADREELRKYYIPVTVAALGVLLSGIVVSCIVISRRRKRDPRTQRDEEAAGQADTDSAWKREDQTRDTGKAELGEGTKKGEVAQANEIFNNSSSPSPWIFAAELAQLLFSQCPLLHMVSAAKPEALSTEKVF